MKKIALVAALAAFSVPAAAAPGDTDTAQGSATAQIVAPISITHTSGAALAFGTLTAGGGGTVTVTTGGVATEGGDVSILTGSTNSADSFSVTGDPSRSFSVSTTGGTVASGTNQMNFTTAVNNASETLSGTGTFTLRVGGTLTVGASQAPGSYTGSYDATVTYN